MRRLAPGESDIIRGNVHLQTGGNGCWPKEIHGQGRGKQEVEMTCFNIASKQKQGFRKSDESAVFLISQGFGEANSKQEEGVVLLRACI